VPAGRARPSTLIAFEGGGGASTFWARRRAARATTWPHPTPT